MIVPVSLHIYITRVQLKLKYYLFTLGINRTESEQQIKDLFPDYESMSSYCNGFTDYIKKNQDAVEEKPKYGESSGSYRYSYINLEHK